jgi:murein DD-endopeptidase MepM/ murein hydrolase activator NlpD
VKPVVVAPVEQYGPGDGPVAANHDDVYLGDASVPNTLQNPSTGTDALTRLQQYTVKAGDTLRGIAAKFGLATSTVYWANKSQIPNTSVLHIGQKLWILPMDGLVIKMSPKITIASLSAKYDVSVQDIVDTNNLPDTNPAPGVLVIIPGASGGAMPRGSNALGPKKNPRVGSWVWPVAGDNYISQYFWSGHHAVDIAAKMGTPVVAATAGTVVYAGWTPLTGGGNVIWIREGTRLYTTYNHLSRIYAWVGERVYAGKKIGLVGMTGNATGPHLHFEVWLGYPWALHTDSDAINPCRYLAGC